MADGKEKKDEILNAGGREKEDKIFENGGEGNLGNEYKTARREVSY